MAMRPFALSALAIVAAVGCGVPDTVVPKAAEPTKAAPTPTTKTPDKKDVTPPTAAVEDPAKLGEKIVDTKVGTGAAAAPGDTCVMRYTGRLKSNGQVFDSNVNNGKDAFTFTLGAGSVIKGWDIGVKGMKVGGKRTLEIPAALGYGAQGGGDKIPPNSDLVFDIELVDLQSQADANTVRRQTIKPGNGPQVKKGDIVTIKYKMMTEGSTKVLDDNGGKPVQFTVGSPAVAIQGLNVALEGMRPGQEVEATIPPSLGYRGPGMGRQIPPNATLLMDITLVKIG